MTSDPKILALALIGGLIPSLVWLWFWLKEDSEKPEPKGLVAAIFFIGMLAVLLTIPLQKLVKVNVDSKEWQFILWAGIEEVIKYLAVLTLLWKSRHIDEPVDFPIHMITAALGFAALENTFYLIKPLSFSPATVALLTGQLRFLGSTLLHAVSSALVGVAMGLSFNFSRSAKRIYLLVGLALATVLHSAFNFFIMDKREGGNFLKVLGFLWVVTVIIMLLFEKLRRMSKVS